jgi:hypothetical protein
MVSCVPNPVYNVASRTLCGSRVSQKICQNWASVEETSIRRMNNSGRSRQYLSLMEQEQKNQVCDKRGLLAFPDSFTEKISSLQLGLSLSPTD